MIKQLQDLYEPKGRAIDFRGRSQWQKEGSIWFTNQEDIITLKITKS